MVQTVILQLPDETANRYRRGATAARKPLEEFILERLRESVPLSDLRTSRLDDDLRRLESLDDEALREIARATLPATQQRRYERLLRKNSEASLTVRERETLAALGDEARTLTVKKAHAWLLLKWRGYDHPLPSDAAIVE
ncbi:MAG: hypothetical protein AB7R89_09730 [Dehalococcoidia bacterium]